MIYTISGGCGVGKTTCVVFPLISTLYSKHDKVCVVVPSLHVQKMYVDYFSNSNISDYVVINHSTARNVVKAVTTAFISHAPVILMTDRAFLSLPTSSLLNDYTLIIDEVFDPFEEVSLSFTHTSGYAPDFKFDELFSFPTEPSDDDTYYPVSLKRFSFETNLLSDQFKRLSSATHQWYLNQKSYASLVNSKAERADVLGVFDTTIFNMFKDAYLSSANFNESSLGKLLSEYKELTKFDGHKDFKSKIKIYYPTITNEYAEVVPLNLTTYVKNKDDKLITNFIDAITPMLTEGIYLSNADDDVILPDTFTKVNHNCHGSNSYSQLKQIVITSAVKPSTNFAKFQATILKTEYKERFLQKSTEIMYQALFRLACRNKDEESVVEAFMADAASALNMVEKYLYNMDVELIPVHLPNILYKGTPKVRMSASQKTQMYRNRAKSRIFDLDSLELESLGYDGCEDTDQFVDNLDIPKKKRGRPTKENKLTKAEYNKRYQDKKKLEKGIDPNAPKKVPMTSAEKVRRHREKKKLEKLQKQNQE